MLVETSNCQQSGEGTPMFSRRGILTIAQHKCFRNKDKAKLKSGMASKPVPTQDDISEKDSSVYSGEYGDQQFMTLDEIKQYLDASNKDYEDQQQQRQDKKLGSLLQKGSYSFKACDRDTCVEAVIMNFNYVEKRKREDQD